MNMNRYEYDDLDLDADEEPVLVCTGCGTVTERSPKPTVGRTFRNCDECDDRTEHDYESRFLKPDEAAAELIARHLDPMGVIEHVNRRGYFLSVWVSDQGTSMANVSDDWNIRLNEIGPLTAYNDEIQETAPDAATYFSAEVLGVRDDPNGYALPTHIPGLVSAEPRNRDEIDDEVIRLCEIAGLDIPTTA